MNKGQSIDDILKLLKDSVSSEKGSEGADKPLETAGEYSDEALQRELKNQYFEGEQDTVYESEDEYALDGNFLSEVELFLEAHDVGEPIVADSKDEEYGEASENAPVTDSFDEVNTVTDDLPWYEPDETEDSYEQSVAEETDSESEAEDEEKNVAPSWQAPTVEDALVVEVTDVNDMFEDELDDELPAEMFDDTPEDVSDEQDVEYISADDQPDGDDEVQFEFKESKDGSAFDEGFETDDYEQDIVYKSLEITTESLGLLSEGVSEDSAEGAETSVSAQIETEPAQAEPRETYLASMRRMGIGISADQPSRVAKADIKADATEKQASVTDEAANTVVLPEVELDAGEVEPPVAEEVGDEDLDLSTISLMMQLCEKEELEQRIGEEKIENILQEEEEEPESESVKASPVQDGEEYVDKCQDEAIRSAYKKKYLTALFSMCGCVLLAIFALIFDLLPILDVEINGIFDYAQYPSFYVLVGLQFVIFSAAICVKQLWQGLKNIASAAPDRYSLVAALICINVVYDAWISIAVAVGGDPLPAVFNGVTAVIIAISAIIDYIKTSSNMQTFIVYSSELQKYTIVNEGERGTIAKKMHAGGLAPNKKVFAVAPIDFPRGLFRGIGEKDGRSRSMVYIMIAALICSIIITVVAAILGLDMYASLGAFMICIFTVMPITLMCADNIPLARASIRLAKRGVAIAGKGSVAKYSKCDVMVFGDLHMFKKCKTEDVGIAIYDTGVSYLTLGCLDALYSRIGGPLSGMQMNLPDVFKFGSVEIRRITRTGIEAVIEKKHVIVLGERSFLQRYGISFPEDEVQTGRSSLCVSLNGGVTAKLSVKYETEPIFEMLIERLYSEGISCAIETYDPLVNSAMIARNRTIGSSPVLVVHKNAEDFRKKAPDVCRGRLDGVVACASRLKLAEAAVWLKRLVSVEKITKIASACFCGGGVLLSALFVITRVVGSINQYHVFAYLLAQFIAFTAILIAKLPRKKYFTVDALYKQLEHEHAKKVREDERKLQKEMAREQKQQKREDAAE